MADSPAIVCGLGNPGRRYRMTRHNLGFLVVERFVERNGDARFQSKFGAEYADLRVAGRRLLAILPQTYMNLSGDALIQFVQYFKVDRADLLVVCDDINLPFPEFRIRSGGGAGGHKGLASIANRLGSPAFARFRIGVGGGDLDETSDYVLSEFSAAERRELDERLDEAACAVETWLADGLERAMNKFNGKVDTPPAV